MSVPRCSLNNLITIEYSPPDNDRYVSRAPDNPKKVYHMLQPITPYLTDNNLC